MKSNNSKLVVNEEDLKNKVLSPYFSSLGFSLNEVYYETSFKIQLGTKEHITNYQRGRSDFLYKSKVDGKNLFIVEAKADNVKIEKIDVEQGLSYARLVHPIAPFVIITNGKDTLVIDTITKKDISGSDISAESEFWKNGCTLAAKEEIELRYEALKNFIGYSPENVEIFSRSQVDSRMQTLKGGIVEKHTKKYIPELFLEKEEINEAFKRFLDDESKCFALIGEAGVGKTNLICGLAENFIKEHIGLFYNAADLATDLVSSIKDDFNWIFSPQLDAPDIFRRLEGLTERRHSKVCIFIDAIDEAPIANFPQVLNDFVYKIRSFKNIKLCVSCKESDWSRFLYINGNPTYLQSSMYKSNDEPEGKEGVEAKPLGTVVSRFDNKELEILDSKYRAVFNYKGALTDDVRNECKLGFMFRVVAEVFENQPLPATCDDAELLKKYIDKKLEKYDQEIGRNYLTEIGNALFDAEVRGLSEEKFTGNSLEESYLRKCLRLNAGDKIPQELFAYNILTRTKNNNGLIFIGFYYTKVRDYVVSFYSLKLPHLGDAEFKSLLPSLFKGPIGLGAISWYTGIASERHSKILLDFHSARGLLFLKEYQRIIETHMPLLKNRFDPYTDGSIGLVMVVHSDGRCTYGFRPLSEGDKIIELLNSIPSKDHLFKIGLKRARFRRDDFLTVDPALAARAEIKEQLGKIIEEGRLNEEFNIGIAKEKAVAIIFKCSEQLGYGKIRNHYVPRIEHLFPISCDDLLKRVKLIYAREYYYKETIEEKIRSGEIRTKQIDFNEIDRKARSAVENDRPIPIPRVIGDIQIYSVLTKALETIKTESSEISEPLFPPPDIPTESIYERVISNGGKPGWIPDLVCAQYSEAQLKKYIEAFFDAYLKEYQKLMEVNFPTYYFKLPTGFYVEAITKGHACLLSFAMKYDRSEPQIEVKINPETSLAFGDAFDNWSSMGLETILWESSGIPLNHHGSSSIFTSVSELCPLRTFLYKKIKYNINFVYEAFN